MKHDGYQETSQFSIETFFFNYFLSFVSDLVETIEYGTETQLVLFDKQNKFDEKKRNRPLISHNHNHLSFISSIIDKYSTKIIQ